jgi:hypothetical protein
VQSRDSIMSARLPLDLGDFGIVTVVVKNLPNQLRQGRCLLDVEPGIGDEPSTASEGDHPNGADPGHGDSARGLCVSAQLLVVGSEKLLDIRHGPPVW